jgi:predicted secreted protein
MPKTTVISASVDKPFEIALESNPTTGYQWHPVVDVEALELKDRSYLAAGEGIGAGGKERLTFSPRKKGEFVLRLEYRRAWEDQPLATKVFHVRVH